MRTVIMTPSCPECERKMTPHSFASMFVCLYCMLEGDLIALDSEACEFVPVWTMDEVLAGLGYKAFESKDYPRWNNNVS